MNLSRSLSRFTLVTALFLAVTETLPAAEETPPAVRYTWQEALARVLPMGDLAWAPTPFVFEPGASVRYIDFENGRDDREGTSKELACKHHPWDTHADRKVKACRGIHIYVFKRGVIYRGALKASGVGVMAEKDPLRDAPRHDFRPAVDSAAPGLGGKVFVPGGSCS